MLVVYEMLEMRLKMFTRMRVVGRDRTKVKKMTRHSFALLVTTKNTFFFFLIIAISQRQHFLM